MDSVIKKAAARQKRAGSLQLINQPYLPNFSRLYNAEICVVDSTSL